MYQTTIVPNRLVSVTSHSGMGESHTPLTTLLNGWVAWSGGECPVAPETKVSILMRDGDKDCDEGRRYRWYHDDSGDDIVAYTTWIEWSGGEQPEPDGTEVEYMVGDGATDQALAEDLIWSHDESECEAEGWIRKYRVVAVKSGWIEWTGGDCPEPGTLVDIVVRCGDQVQAGANHLNWSHDNNVCSSHRQIVKYRVVNQKQDSEGDAVADKFNPWDLGWQVNNGKCPTAEKVDVLFNQDVQAGIDMPINPVKKASDWSWEKGAGSHAIHAWRPHDPSLGDAELWVTPEDKMMLAWATLEVAQQYENADARVRLRFRYRKKVFELRKDEVEKREEAAA